MGGALLKFEEPSFIYDDNDWWQFTGHRRWKYAPKHDIVIPAPRVEMSADLYADGLLVGSIESFSRRTSLVVRKDYWWDGATGAPDNLPPWRRGLHVGLSIPTLIHDIACQFLRCPEFRYHFWDRFTADQWFYYLLRHYGWRLAPLYYSGVRLHAAMPKRDDPSLSVTLYAP